MEVDGDSKLDPELNKQHRTMKSASKIPKIRIRKQRARAKKWSSDCSYSSLSDTPYVSDVEIFSVDPCLRQSEAKPPRDYASITTGPLASRNCIASVRLADTASSPHSAGTGSGHFASMAAAFTARTIYRLSQRVARLSASDQTSTNPLRTEEHDAEYTEHAGGGACGRPLVRRFDHSSGHLRPQNGSGLRLNNDIHLDDEDEEEEARAGGVAFCVSEATQSSQERMKRRCGGLDIGLGSHTISSQQISPAFDSKSVRQT
ncbi:unnamed protein product [Protopolystoma xenopodis]|uniref:Uncharacterized protein n=1 Tax=Protopolystoma xenopodis TaxID=117903 RepID=A0A448WIL7_9PLAT|nr:unnamed protein product [Protopolystoma xenopodis]